MSITATANARHTAQIIHPIMRIQLQETGSRGAGYDEDGNERAAEWGMLENSIRIVPIEMHWGSNGDLSILTFRHDLGAGQGDSQSHPEDISIWPGTRARLYDQDTDTEWFEGLIALDSMLIQADPQRESRTYTAYGPELRLQQKVVMGQWWANNAAADAQLAGTSDSASYIRSNIYQTHLKAVFNADGKSNCGEFNWNLYTPGNLPKDISISTTHSRVFVAPEITIRGGATAVYTLFAAEKWTAYRALRSLVEYIDDYDVISPSGTNWKAIYNILGGSSAIPLRDVDVDGMDLLQAIRTVLGSVGYGFYLEPWTTGYEHETHKHRLIVYSLKDPLVKKTPYLPAFGESVTGCEGLRGEVQRLHFVRDDHRVKNDIIILGQPKRVQVKIEYKSSGGLLKPRWTPATYPLSDYVEDNKVVLQHMTSSEFEIFYDIVNPHAETQGRLRHVWRSFGLNEDGALGPFIADVPDLYSNFGIGESGKVARRPRPIGPMIEYRDDSFADYCGPRVQLTVTDANLGAVTIDITAFCEIWKDRAGFTVQGGEWGGPEGVQGNLYGFGEGFDISYWCPFKSYKRFDELAEATQEISYLTLLHNTIRDAGLKMTLALIGTMEDDLCIKGTSHRIKNSSWPLLAKKVVRIPHFEKQSVHADGGTGGIPDEKDDSTAIGNYADRIRDITEDQMGHGSIMLPMLSRSYQPGDAIPYLAGRDIDLHVDGGLKDAWPVVRGVRFSFAEPPSTEILLDSSLLRVTG
ncbi:MAG: hypothetical protein KAV00_06890 [Phycisphaerae bacterium]|nr:hypothetical protein [Phycisphaerae bacterium]